MMEKVVKKEILRIRFRIVSPLIIGSGNNEDTDNDIALNGAGHPYIPGTAVAGVIRSLLSEGNDHDGMKFSGIKDYFGYVPDYKEAQTGMQAITSRIVFYDANIVAPFADDKRTYHISKRDCVALDRWKTARKGAKYDMQILEPGVLFETFVEQNISEKAGNEFLDIIAGLWKAEAVRFGAKTMRGFGKVQVEDLKKIIIDFRKPSDVLEWLDHTIYDEKLWRKELLSEINEFSKEEIGKYAKEKSLKLELRVRSAMSIRRYTTDVRDEDSLLPQPDYMQLTVHGSKGEVPVIPGTTWAGAFRSNMRKLNAGLDESCFGTVDQDKNIKTRSGILFSESTVREGKTKLLTRNAIDRFSGGTADSALYSEKTVYGGKTDLEIRFCDIVPSNDIMIALAASIADLQAGLLSVGGLTSVGRGLFEVVSINGEHVTQEPQDVYNKAIKVITGLFKEKQQEA